MEKINWNLKISEREKIKKIVSRAVELYESVGQSHSELEIRMDIMACHLNGTPLNLNRLFEFDDFNFAHDIFGIAKHINRRTGKIERHFVPRCAK